MAAMASLHLGLEKIGVVLAALGVGLGFGLQEIVSNFVSGIILLLERPIRVGDVVTVAGMSGKVDRINIRATTIINGDNQSLIVPNREFITGNLVNWTHKDRILRVNIPVNVAYGADPDAVSDLLLAIARNDADVLRNPVPTAFLEGFGDFGMSFALHVHVPDPSLAGPGQAPALRRDPEAVPRRRDRDPDADPRDRAAVHVGRGPDESTPIVWPAGMRVDRGLVGHPADEDAPMPGLHARPGGAVASGRGRMTKQMHSSRITENTGDWISPADSVALRSALCSASVVTGCPPGLRVGRRAVGVEDLAELAEERGRRRRWPR